MRSGAASGTEGYFHEAALYGSDDEFLAVVLPFLTDGVDAGEPTLVTLGEANSQLVRSALTNTRGISFMPGEMQYARPAASIRAYQELMAEHTRKGATQIRIVGDVPHPGVGVEWGWWARYEAAVNDAYDAYPVWGLCPYDARRTPTEVLADVTRTHPHLATVDGGHVINPDFVDPSGFLADLIYGTAPTTLRIWNYRDRLVAHVTDAGAGPTDPYAGLLRAADTTGAGLGLWLAHQMCADVTLHRHRGGFTLRIATAN